MSENLEREIEWIARHHKAEPIFQTQNIIYFREIEDVIAWIVKNKPKVFKVPAWRYYCRENGRAGAKGINRLYYMIEASYDGKKFVKLVCQGATDYSGHGSRDMKIAEFFISKVLNLRIEERPVSYLINLIVDELYRMTHSDMGIPR